MHIYTKFQHTFHLKASRLNRISIDVNSLMTQVEIIYILIRSAELENFSMIDDVPFKASHNTFSVVSNNPLLGIVLTLSTTH